MQIMNFEKLVEKLEWFFSASKVIEMLPDPIIFVDLSGYILKANVRACECFDINGSNNEKFNDIIKDGSEMIKKSLNLKKPVVAMAMAKGQEFYVEMNASRRWDGYCLVIRDITKLTDEVSTEKKIDKFNNEKNAMLVKIEDDIKSPLTSIIGFSKGLLDGLGGDLSEKQKKYIQIINSSSAGLYSFVDKFLEFTYAESSQYEPEYRNFDVVEILKEITRDYEHEISEKQLGLTFDYEAIEKRTVYYDVKSLQKTFRNIYETSLSMTEKGGISIKIDYPDEETVMSLNLDENKSYVRILIKDTGIGIEASEIKYLCDPYTQLTKNKKNFVRALKLGAASILTKRANGYIDISSEVMNGTLYTLVIPIQKD